MFILRNEKQTFLIITLKTSETQVLYIATHVYDEPMTLTYFYVMYMDIMNTKIESIHHVLHIIRSYFKEAIAVTWPI